MLQPAVDAAPNNLKGFSNLNDPERYPRIIDVIWESFSDLDG